MVKQICRDVNFLKIKSTNLESNELYVLDDLLDTLKFKMSLIKRHH